MARWEEVVASDPGLAERVRAALDAHVHKTIATLRRDGSPRISGIEATFADGDLWVGSMLGAVKARDLQRDPRYALHSGSEDPPGWSGDGKVAGRAAEVTDQATLERVYPPSEEEGPMSVESMHLFRLDVDELVWTGLDESRSKLVIDSWHQQRGRRRFER
jgi:hypothetical protein